MSKVAVVVGSVSDLPTISKATEVLERFKIPHEVFIISAHRTPQKAHEFALRARSGGFSVIIAGAGGAAHLAGVIASLTPVPVIGVPMETKAFKGLDSFLSTLQMPSGVPVATMAVGEAGAFNAGVLACQILALSDESLMRKVQTFKEELARIVEEKNRALRAKRKK